MLSLEYLPMKKADRFIMHHSDQVSYLFPDLQDQTLLMLCWRSFSEWVREHVTFSFAYKGGCYLNYEYLQPIATQIAYYARPKIVDAPLTLIFTIGQGACLSLIDYEGGQYIKKKTMTYQCQYCAIDGSMSECDHK